MKKDFYNTTALPRRNVMKNYFSVARNAQGRAP